MVLLGEDGPYTDVRGRRGSTPAPGTPSGSVRLMQGMEGVLRSNEAIGTEIARVAQDMRVNSEQIARMTSTVADALRSQQQMTSAITQTLGALGVAAATGGSAPVGPNGLPTGAPPAPPSVPSGDYQRAPGVPLPTSTWLPPGAAEPALGPINTQGIPQGGDPRQQQANWDALQQGRQTSLSDLRQNIVRSVGSRISGTQFGPRLATGPFGQMVRVDADGGILGDATDADLRNVRIANRLRTVGGNVAEQGLARGLINSLPAGAAKGLGAAGAAYAVINEGLNIAEDQREQNASWQRISGGDNLSGFRDRIDANLFRLTQRGTMSGQQANALYRGVYETGLQGEERQGALDFATEQWRAFGMEINDSLALIRRAAQAGQSGLVGVADALEQVTAASREAGVNAEAYREIFSRNYSASVGTLTGSGTAASASGALTSAQALLGHQFENIDFSGAFSTDSLRQFAANQGQNLTTYLGQNQGQAGAANIIGSVQTQVLRIAQNALGQEGIAIIKAWKAQRGITEPLTAEQSNLVAAEIMRSQVGSRIDPQGLISQLRTMAGISVSDINDVVPLLIRTVDGGWDPGRQVQEQVESSRQVNLSSAGLRNSRTTGGDSISSLGDVYEAIGYSREARQQEQGGAAGLANLFSGGRMSSAEALYADQVRESGSYSPVVGKLLKEGANNQRFRINVGTEDKPVYREMDIKDAVKYHSDQLARGDVLITEGEGKDQTVAEALGMAVSDTEVNYNQAGKDAGKAYEEGSAATGRAPSGLVYISASPELQRLLQFSATGGATYTESVPTSMVPGSALPTGNR